MKTEIKPIYNNIMVRPYSENPYLVHKTESGLVLTDGQFENPDTGNIDVEKLGIITAQVIEVGPECKYIKKGDDVMYSEVVARPIPFFDQGFFLMNEQGVLAVLNDDLSERF